MNTRRDNMAPSVVFDRTSNLSQRKRRLSYLPWGITVILVVYLTGFMIAKSAKKDFSSNSPDNSHTFKIVRHKREILFTQIINLQNATINATTTPLPKSTGEKKNNGIYPPDVFDREKRRNGKI